MKYAVTAAVVTLWTCLQAHGEVVKRIEVTTTNGKSQELNDVRLTLRYAKECFGRLLPDIPPRPRADLSLGGPVHCGTGYVHDREGGVRLHDKD